MRKRKQNKKKLNINGFSLINKSLVSNGPTEQDNKAIKLEPYIPPKHVLPPNVKHKVPKVANDSGYEGFVGSTFFGGYNTVYFKGYQHYAHLANMPEFRKIVEVISTEMTREWIDIKYAGDDDKAKEINQIIDEVKRIKLQSKISELISVALIHGRGQLYLDLKRPSGTGRVYDDADELKSPLILSSSKIAKNGFAGVNVVEPINTTPAVFNFLNPLADDYMEARTWYVNQKEVHSDRLLTLVMSPVATNLRPYFNYGGLSFIQMLEPTTNNWLTVRDNGKELVKNSNVFVLKTDLSGVLQASTDETIAAQEATSVKDRLRVFTETRNTRSVMAVDRELEDVINVNISMSGIPEMVTKYQEQLSQISGIPIVKLTGNTPSGLNASSEGEIRVFYDMMLAMNEAYIRDIIQKVIDVIQVSLYGEIDSGITFDFNPLYQQSEKETEELRAIKASKIAEAYSSGIITDVEARAALKNSDDPDFAHLEEADIEKEPDEEYV